MYLKGFGIPEIITYGHSGKYNVLIQQLLGKTLIDIFKIKKKKKNRTFLVRRYIDNSVMYLKSFYIKISEYIDFKN